MRKEEPELDVAGELAQVPVVPGRLRAVEDPGAFAPPYQPIPNPSPFVSSAPSCECRLWSISEFFGP